MTLPEPTEVVVMDMAGTTVKDDGLVERAFTAALDANGIATDPTDRRVAMEFVRSTMGQSKIVVFTELVRDPERGAQLNRDFEQAYDDLVAEGLAEEIPGARGAITALRAAGIRVALTTGFAPHTQAALIDALGWGDIIDRAFSPADVGGRGRPLPDLNLAALAALHGSSAAAMVVVGDTSSDMRSGVASGAGRVVGVMSGAHSRERLREAGATDVIADVTELPALLGL
jgi:phosphoglycolate phosphatase